MCHSAFFGSQGTVQNIRDHVEFTGKHVEAIMEEVYKGFLTAEEFESLRKGCELWFDYDQINERLEKMFTQETEEMQEEYKPLEVMISEAVESALNKTLDKREKKASAKAKKLTKETLSTKIPYNADSDDITPTDLEGYKSLEKTAVKPSPKLTKALEQAEEIRNKWKELEENDEFMSQAPDILFVDPNDK